MIILYIMVIILQEYYIVTNTEINFTIWPLIEKSQKHHESYVFRVALIGSTQPWSQEKQFMKLGILWVGYEG